MNKLGTLASNDSAENNVAALGMDRAKKCLLWQADSIH
jgi:hypothetical protein